MKLFDVSSVTFCRFKSFKSLCMVVLRFASNCFDKGCDQGKTEDSKHQQNQQKPATSTYCDYLKSLQHIVLITPLMNMDLLKKPPQNKTKRPTQKEQYHPEGTQNQAKATQHTKNTPKEHSITHKTNKKPSTFHVRYT